jgi:hypothetical protein
LLLAFAWNCLSACQLPAAAPARLHKLSCACSPRKDIYNSRVNFLSFSHKKRTHNYSEIMKSLIAFVLPLTSQAWTSLPSRSLIAPPHKTRCSLSSQSAETDTDNPCWQDIWNYDCAMSNIYSASFIAQDWIQSMPCAMGIEVSSIHLPRLLYDMSLLKSWI